MKSTAIAIGLFLVTCIPSAEAAIKIDVRYVIVETEVYPRQETRRNDQNWGTDFILDHGKVVTHNAYEIVTSGMKQSFNSENKFHRRVNISYKIRNGLVTQTSRFEGSTIIVSVRTNGIDACEAFVDFKKLAGQQYIIGRRIKDGELMYLSDKHAENVTCRISSVSSE